MNKIERWFKRNDVSATMRKMKEWKIISPEKFFEAVFESDLTEEEIHYLYFRFPKEYKKEKNDYIYV